MEVDYRIEILLKILDHKIFSKAEEEVLGLKMKKIF